MRCGIRTTTAILVSLAVMLQGCEPFQRRDQPADMVQPAEFSYFTGGIGEPGDPKYSNETEIGKLVQELTGVNIRYVRHNGDLKSQIGVMMASGDYPDILVGSAGFTGDFINAGALIPLDELVETHAPNLRRMYDEVWDRLKHPADGRIYHLPSLIPQGEAPAKTTQSGFGIQRAVLEEAGYPRQETIGDYFRVLKQYKERHPKLYGYDTAGYVILHDGWVRTLNWANEMLNGIMNDGKAEVDPRTLEVTIKQTDDKLHDTLQVFNQAYLDGLIDPQSFLYDERDYNERLATGSVLGGWMMPEDVKQSLKRQKKEERIFYHLPLRLHEQSERAPEPIMIPSGEGVGISVKAKDPVRIVRFWDWMCRIEHSKLLYWGVEGRHYAVNAEGRMIRTAEQLVKFADPQYRKQVGLEYWHFGWPSFEGHYPDGNAWDPSYQPEVREAGYDVWDRKFMAAYGLSHPAELNETDDRPLLPHFPLWTMNIEFGTKPKVVEARIEEVADRWYPLLVMAPAGQFEAVWEQYLEQFRTIDLDAYKKRLEQEIRYRNTHW